MRPNRFSIEALPYFASDVIWNHGVSSDDGAGPAHTHNKNGFKRKRKRLSASVLEGFSLTHENQPPGGVSDSLGSSAADQFYKQKFMCKFLQYTFGALLHKNTLLLLFAIKKVVKKNKQKKPKTWSYKTIRVERAAVLLKLTAVVFCIPSPLVESTVWFCADYVSGSVLYTVVWINEALNYGCDYICYRHNISKYTIASVNHAPVRGWGIRSYTAMAKKICYWWLTVLFL